MNMTSRRVVIYEEKAEPEDSKWTQLTIDLLADKFDKVIVIKKHISEPGKICLPNVEIEVGSIQKFARVILEENLDFDEIVYFNDNLIGPFDCFWNVLSKMAVSEKDAWVIRKKENADCVFDYDFIVLKKKIFSILLSNHFRLKNSQNFTIIKIDEIHKFDEQQLSIFTFVDRLLIIEKLIFLPKKYLLQDFETLYATGAIAGFGKVMDWILVNSPRVYDCLLAESISQKNIAELYDIYHLCFSFEQLRRIKQENKKNKVALFAHIYYRELVEVFFDRIKQITCDIDIYITSSNKATLKRAEDFIELGKGKGKCRNIYLIEVPARGRDVSALLIGLRNYYNKYEICCFVHDKKSSQVKPHENGYFFFVRCLDNLLGSGEQIKHIINLFNNLPHLGLLVPPEPNFGHYWNIPGNEWTNNFRITEKLKSQLKLNCIMSSDKRPLCPLGGMFWFRTTSMRKIFEFPWSTDNFYKEPMPSDGTISHAIERIWPFVAQDSGFFSAEICMDSYLKSDYLTNSNKLRLANKARFLRIKTIFRKIKLHLFRWV